MDVEIKISNGSRGVLPLDLLHAGGRLMAKALNEIGDPRREDVAASVFEVGMKLIEVALEYCPESVRKSLDEQARGLIRGQREVRWMPEIVDRTSGEKIGTISVPMPLRQAEKLFGLNLSGANAVTEPPP